MTRAATTRARLNDAGALQPQRYAAEGLFCNTHMLLKQLQDYCRLEAGRHRLLESAMGRLGLNVRSRDRALKVAQAMADLAGLESIGAEHVAEAIQYRGLDRERWSYERAGDRRSPITRYQEGERGAWPAMCCGGGNKTSGRRLCAGKGLERNDETFQARYGLTVSGLSDRETRRELLPKLDQWEFDLCPSAWSQLVTG